jgi:hypothetical protein
MATTRGGRNDNLGIGSFRLRDLYRGTDYGLAGAPEARQPGKVYEVDGTTDRI